MLGYMPLANESILLLKGSGWLLYNLLNLTIHLVWYMSVLLRLASRRDTVDYSEAC